MPDIFAIKYHESYIPDYHLIKDDLISDIKSRINSSLTTHPYAKGGSIIMTEHKSKFNLIDIKHGKTILDFVNEQLKVYWNDLNYSDKYEPYIVNAWASMNPKGGTWLSHNHAPSSLAGCFYVSAQIEQGPIVFEHPLELVLGYQPYTNDMPDQLLQHTVIPESGKLLLFPGYLKHRVEENTLDEYRIIIGFDITHRTRDKS